MPLSQLAQAHGGRALHPNQLKGRQMRITIDKTIEAVVPRPAQSLVMDDPKKDPATPVVWDAAASWQRQLIDYIKTYGPKTLHIWKGKGIILDGIESYQISKKLGYKVDDFDLIEVPCKNLNEAKLYRWRINITTQRNITDFVKVKYFLKNFGWWMKQRKSAALKNKKGRGKSVVPDDKINTRVEFAEMAGVKHITYHYCRYIINYAAKPAIERAPDYNNQEMKNKLRRLENGSIFPKPIYADIVSKHNRLKRKLKSQKNKGRSGGRRSNAVQKLYTPGDTNIVIAGDCLDILDQFPIGDPYNPMRWAYSPPYYGIQIWYGGKFRILTWQQYKDWTKEYLTKLWAILPEGGVISANVDNTTGDDKIRRYTTDLYRTIVFDFPEVEDMGEKVWHKYQICGKKGRKRK